MLETNKLQQQAKELRIQTKKDKAIVDKYALEAGTLKTRDINISLARKNFCICSMKSRKSDLILTKRDFYG